MRKSELQNQSLLFSETLKDAERTSKSGEIKQGIFNLI